MKPSSKSEIEYFCPKCGEGVSSPVSEAGGTAPCPACGSLNTIPDPQIAEADLHSQKEEIVKFYCTHCEQKLSSPVGFAGRSFDCPNCGKGNVVPGEKPAPIPAPVELDVVKFFCGHCGQKLACGTEAAGKTIDCPVCFEPTAVPGASPSVFSPEAKTGPIVPKPTARLTPPPKKPLPPVKTESDLPSLPVARAAKPPAPIQRPDPEEAKEARETAAAKEVAAAKEAAKVKKAAKAKKAAEAMKAAEARKAAEAKKAATKKAAAKKAAAKKKAAPARKVATKERKASSPDMPRSAEGGPSQRGKTKAEEMSEARERLKESLRAEARAEANREGSSDSAAPGFPLQTPVPMKSSPEASSKALMQNRAPSGSGNPEAPKGATNPVQGQLDPKPTEAGPLKRAAEVAKTVVLKTKAAARKAVATKIPPKRAATKKALPAERATEPLRLTDPVTGANRTILPPPRPVSQVEEDVTPNAMEPVRLTELVPAGSEKTHPQLRSGPELVKRVSDAMADDPFEEGLADDDPSGGHPGGTIRDARG